MAPSAGLAAPPLGAGGGPGAAEAVAMVTGGFVAVSAALRLRAAESHGCVSEAHEHPHADSSRWAA